MPRPKRTRVASTRIVAKATSPEHVMVPKQTAESSSDIYDVSDREKEKAKQRRESMRDADTITRTRPTSSHQLKALEAARQRRDSAMDRLENMTSTSTNQPDEPDEHEEPSVELGRKVAGTPQQRRIGDMSGLDLDDSAFDDLNTTFDTAGPASAQRSAETSILSASVFKRRPRAGSFLSREDGHIRPSSRAGPNTPAFSSTFNIGMFKRRVREPSILGTAQKPRPQPLEPEPEPESEPESDQDEDEEAIEEDGFAPEAESTPLKPSKRRSGGIEAGSASPQDLPPSNSRKRKSTKGHERRAKSSPLQDEDPVEDPGPQQSDSELSSPPSTPPPRQQSSRPATPIMDEELMAPPMSSGSSSGDSDVWPPLQSLARTHFRRPVSALQRTPVANDNVSDISSPPSLTYSPNYRKPSPPPRQAAKAKRKGAAKSEPKAPTADLASLSTLELASLLPRRRCRHARADDEDSEAEVDISGLGDDDDELSYLDVRARRQPARPGSRAGHSKKQNAGRARPASRGKTAKQTQGTNRRATITYGRTSDKENQGESEGGETDHGEANREQRDGEESSRNMDPRVEEELKNAARKFQEVDKWQLDYEEVTETSSP
ncbi:uncharacterized protein F4812DRAFT_326322 [Daldinia caldariorum]|uniref:uncharacterized protein n=1 Tax=Daldinia caldariorum TaxID=326644 RepID=UPI002007AA59|nr:uncharacterized protein F4812DRAFT_326322 [Daldinia caldariorum]KAI1469346.1 hypothetical protein F4812DRAFT_326322 [Daldinia caldariorum]